MQRSALDLASLRPALRAGAQTYNHLRPHQALRNVTPAEVSRYLWPPRPLSQMELTRTKACFAMDDQLYFPLFYLSAFWHYFRVS
jgi:hypothetical protein